MIGIPELAVLAAAGYRGTQLVVHDTILDPVRARLFAWHARKTTSRPRTAAVTLISCIYCSGWWISGAFLAAYLHTTGQWNGTPLAVHGIEWFAVAGTAVLANRWDDASQDRS